MNRMIFAVLMVLGVILSSGQAFAKKPFRMDLLSWDEYTRLAATERMAYLHDLRFILATMERSQRRYEMASLSDFEQMKEQIALFIQQASLLPAASAQTRAEDCGPDLYFVDGRCVNAQIKRKIEKQKDADRRAAIRFEEKQKEVSRALKDMGDESVRAGRSTGDEAKVRAGKIARKEAKDIADKSERVIREQRQGLGLGNTWQNPEYFNADGTAKVRPPPKGADVATAPPVEMPGVVTDVGPQEIAKPVQPQLEAAKSAGPPASANTNAGSAQEIREAKAADAIKATEPKFEQVAEVLPDGTKKPAAPAAPAKPDSPVAQISDSKTEPTSAAKNNPASESNSSAEAPAPVERECKVEEVKCEKPSEQLKEAYRKENNQCIYGGRFTAYKSGKAKAGQCDSSFKDSEGKIKDLCNDGYAACSPSVFCAALVYDDKARNVLKKYSNVGDQIKRLPLLYPLGDGQDAQIFQLSICAKKSQDHTLACSKQLAQMLDPKNHSKLGASAMSSTISLPRIVKKGDQKLQEKIEARVNLTGTRILACDPAKIKQAALGVEISPDLNPEERKKIEGQQENARQRLEAWKITKKEIEDNYEKMCGSDAKYKAMFCYECQVIREKAFAWSDRIRAAGEKCGRQTAATALETKADDSKAER